MKSSDCYATDAQGRNYEVVNSIFRPSLLLLLWWLQRSEISSGGVIFNPPMLAVILSVCDHARTVIPKCDKHIRFRQHHVFMYVRIHSKKRKYLIVKLPSTSSCKRSFYCRCSGCINMWDVLINMLLKLGRE